MQDEHIQYWHNNALPQVELSRADFKRFEFAAHVHLDYHLGVVTSGGQRYRHQGHSYLLSPGAISTLNPDEMHNGQSYNEQGYRAHVMAIPPQYLVQISNELGVAETFFRGPLLNQNDLYHAFLQLHQLLISDLTTADALQQETTMMAFVTELCLRHSDSSKTGASSNFRLSAEQLRQIKAMFHDEPSQSFQLDVLANSLSLSKFQFLRQFKQSVGITPHAYLKRIRLEYAKKALLNGQKIADVAHQVGFFDQSHFNKAFKSAFLITPANFQRHTA